MTNIPVRGPVPARPASSAPAAMGAIHRTIWRWHFYAGLFVIPLILILAVTGAIYLFKPQIEAWEESAWKGFATTGSVTPNAQVEAAMAAHPRARFAHYRLPRAPGHAAMVHLGDGERMLDVFVSPQGKVLASLDAENRIAAFIRRVHGSLLIGEPGSWMVELAASWAFVMLLTGLYLWWPRGGGLAGVLWPRLLRGRRLFWRDLHAVTGFWVAGLALVLLVSALPWTSVWGEGFSVVREELKMLGGKRDWKVHSGHDHDAMMQRMAAGKPLPSLSQIVDRARRERLPYPVLVEPPGEDMVWTVKSASQNLPANRTITYDMASGAELSRTGFADKHPIDQAVLYGIAWHEGHLFGWVNQLIGLLTAIALMAMVVSGFVMWRRRKPDAGLGAPPPLTARMTGAVVILVLLAALLPLLGASLLLLLVFDRFALPRWPRAARWLGVGIA